MWCVLLTSGDILGCCKADFHSWMFASLIMHTFLAFRDRVFIGGFYAIDFLVNLLLIVSIVHGVRLSDTRIPAHTLYCMHSW